MTEIIKNGQVVDDAWQTLKLAEGEAADTVALPETPTLVPLALWRVRRDELLARKIPFGLWLDSHDEPEEIADDLAHFALVAVNFPKFADGRGYSTARLLRERYRYTGELRAIGDVQRDQLFLLRRCGFDAFALRADKDIRDALAGFQVFSERYQSAVDEPLPLFRRRAAGASSHA